MKQILKHLIAFVFVFPVAFATIAFELLAASGEWYVNRTMHKLYG